MVIFLNSFHKPLSTLETTVLKQVHVKLGEKKFVFILGHLDVVQFFMNSNEFTEVRNKREETPLHLSSKGGHEDVVKFIFEKVTLKEPRDKNGAVPLHMATFYGQLNVVKYLISVVEHKDPKNRFGYTPLHFAGIF